MENERMSIRQTKVDFNHTIYREVEAELGPRFAKLLWLMAFDGRPSPKQDDQGWYLTGWRTAEHFAVQMNISKYTIRRMWKQLRAGGWLEQWRIPRGLAYRIRARSKELLQWVKGGAAVANVAVRVADAARSLAARSMRARPTNQIQPSDSDRKDRETAARDNGWRGKVMDKAAAMVNSLIGIGIGRPVAQRMADSGLDERVIAETWKAVRMDHTIINPQGVLAYRLLGLRRRSGAPAMSALPAGAPDALQAIQRIRNARRFG
jgi:hypothetical protein